MLAIGSRSSPNSLIQSLRESGADPHLSDAIGRTVLHWAAIAQNVWAIKWLIAENVNLEAELQAGGPSVRKTAFHILFDACIAIFKKHDTGLSHSRGMQALVLAGANVVTHSPNNERTLARLTEDLNWLILSSEKLSNASCKRSGERMEEVLLEIRNIVHVLTDTLSNPSPLIHLCRIQIRWAPSQYKDRLIYVWRFPC